MSITRGANISAAVLIAACCHLTPALAEPLACDDGIKTAFRPDADTSVIAVRLVKKGEELKAPDALGRAHQAQRRPRDDAALAEPGAHAVKEIRIFGRRTARLLPLTRHDVKRDDVVGLHAMAG